MDIQKNQIQESFEKLYVKNAPDWSLERDQDGGYKYHATQSAFLLFEEQQIEIDLLKAELAKAQAVPYEPGSFKSSHEIIINETKSELIDGYDIAKEDEYLLESLVYRGVCIGKAQAVPEGFVLAPVEEVKTWYLDDDESIYREDPDWLCNTPVGEVVEVERRISYELDQAPVFAAITWDEDNQDVGYYETFATKDEAEKAAAHCKAMIEAQEQK